MHTRHSILILLTASFLFCGNAWSSQAGLVQFVHGDVTVTDVSGASRAAHKGGAINEGDTLVSAQGASAQIKMDDGGFIAVRPNTRLKFDSFKFSKKKDEPESAFFSLFKGGFRAITGLIGRIRHEDYKINTPVATIGIRGTDHEPFYVPVGQPGIPPGAYDKVNVGETTITTQMGTVNVLPNQMGFAGGPNQMPQILPINTNLFTVVPPPAPNSGTGNGGNNNGESGTRDTAVVDPVTPTSTGGNQTPAGGVPNTTPPSVVVNSTQTLSAPLPAQGIGGIGYFPPPYIPCECSGNVFSGTAQYTTNAAGDMNSFTATGPYLFATVSGDLGSASIVDTGSNLLAGNLHWGRWAGTGITLSDPYSGPTAYSGYLVYIGGDIPTMPVTGTATYVPIGGTVPVDVHGNTGQFLGASLSVDFQAATLNVNSMRIGFGGNTFNMTGMGYFDPNGVVPSVYMNGTCAGATCSSVANNYVYGSAAGAFTGPNAAGLGLAYEVMSSGTGGSVDVIGAQGFVKQ